MEGGSPVKFLALSLTIGNIVAIISLRYLDDPLVSVDHATDEISNYKLTNISDNLATLIKHSMENSSDPDATDIELEDELIITVRQLLGQEEGKDNLSDLNPDSNEFDKKIIELRNNMSDWHKILSLRDDCNSLRFSTHVMYICGFFLGAVSAGSRGLNGTNIPASPRILSLLSVLALVVGVIAFGYGCCLAWIWGSKQREIMSQYQETKHQYKTNVKSLSKYWFVKFIGIVSLSIVLAFVIYFVYISVR